MISVLQIWHICSMCCCCCSIAKSCPISCNSMTCSMPGLPNLHYVPEFAQPPGHWVSDSIQPSDPLSPDSPPSLCLSQDQVSSSESALCIRWPKYWSFSLTINPSNEYSGLISFKFDWFDLLAVQGTLKSLFQHHILKASILQRSTLWPNSHIYMTTRKIIALTIQTFVGKVMYLLLNILPRFVIAFLPRSRCFFNFVHSNLESKKIKFVTVSTFSPYMVPWSDGADVIILVFLNV